MALTRPTLYLGLIIYVSIASRTRGGFISDYSEKATEAAADAERRLFSCDNGRKIMETYLCDGLNDCPDNSDERDCGCERDIDCNADMYCEFPNALVQDLLEMFRSKRETKKEKGNCVLRTKDKHTVEPIPAGPFEPYPVPTAAPALDAKCVDDKDCPQKEICCRVLDRLVGEHLGKCMNWAECREQEGTRCVGILLGCTKNSDCCTNCCMNNLIKTGITSPMWRKCGVPNDCNNPMLSALKGYFT